MTQAYTTIQSILETQLKTVVGLPTFTAENIQAQVIATKPFSRATLIPAQTQIIGVGQNGLRMDQGLYQVDLFYPQNSGNTIANAMSDLIMNTFKRGTYYTSGNVRILINRVYRLPANSLTQATFYHIGLVVEWQYYVQG